MCGVRKDNEKEEKEEEKEKEKEKGGTDRASLPGSCQVKAGKSVSRYIQTWQTWAGQMVSNSSSSSVGHRVIDPSNRFVVLEFHD